MMCLALHIAHTSRDRSTASIERCLRSFEKLRTPRTAKLTIKSNLFGVFFMGYRSAGILRSMCLFYVCTSTIVLTMIMTALVMPCRNNSPATLYPRNHGQRQPLTHHLQPKAFFGTHRLVSTAFSLRSRYFIVVVTIPACLKYCANAFCLSFTWSTRSVPTSFEILLAKPKKVTQL